MLVTRFSWRKSAIHHRDGCGSNHYRSSRTTRSRWDTRKQLWGPTASAGVSLCGSSRLKGRVGRLRWKLRALSVELFLHTTEVNCESESEKYPPSGRLLLP